MDVPGAFKVTLLEYNKDYTDCKPGLPPFGWVGEMPVKFIAVPLRHADLVGARGQTLLKTRETNQVRIFNPCFCTTASNLSAAPLGRFAPVSHFSTVLSLVLR